MLFDKLKREKRHTYEVPKRDPGLDQPLSPTLEDTLARLAQLTGQTADLQVNRLEVEERHLQRLIAVEGGGMAEALVVIR